MNYTADGDINPSSDGGETEHNVEDKNTPCNNERSKWEVICQCVDSTFPYNLFNSGVVHFLWNKPS